MNFKPSPILLWLALNFIGLLLLKPIVQAIAPTLTRVGLVVGVVFIIALVPGLLEARRWRMRNLALLASIISLLIYSLTDFGNSENPVFNAALITSILAIGALLLRVLAQGMQDKASNPHISLIRRVLQMAAFIVMILIMNILMLVYFNPLQWPFMWPDPLLYVIIALVAAYVLFPSMTSGAWLHRIIGAAMLFVGQALLLHTIFVLIAQPSPLGIVYFIGFAGLVCVTSLNFINQLTPKAHRQTPTITEHLPVAVIIPTYGEPIEVLEQTVASILRLEYPPDRLFVVVSDDGHREEVRSLAARYGVRYNPGPRRDAKAGNLNDALAYIGIHAPATQLILTQDADEVIHPHFLRKMVGFFNADPRMAFVQGGKEAFATPNDLFGTRDRIFYDVMQVGRNGTNAAFACGSAVLWRLEPLEQIGGFSTWNVVEDLTTSYHLHAAGYRSEYVSEIFSIGLAPEDIPGLIKQRGTWAVDNWRLFLFDNPLWRKGLTLAQRLQYLELGMFYACTAFFTPIIMIVPVWTLLTGDYIPLQGAAVFPWIVTTALYYIAISHGRVAHVIRMWQYWICMGPTYLYAFFIALRSRTKKPSYKVTRKTRLNGFYGHLVLPQLLYLVLGTISLLGLVLSPRNIPFDMLLINAFIVIFFAMMYFAIIRAAFYKVTWTRAAPVQESPAQPLNVAVGSQASGD